MGILENLLFEIAQVTILLIGGLLYWADRAVVLVSRPYRHIVETAI